MSQEKRRDTSGLGCGNLTKDVQDLILVAFMVLAWTYIRGNTGFKEDVTWFTQVNSIKKPVPLYFRSKFTH